MSLLLLALLCICPLPPGRGHADPPPPPPSPPAEDGIISFPLRPTSTLLFADHLHDDYYGPKGKNDDDDRTAVQEQVRPDHHLTLRHLLLGTNNGGGVGVGGGGGIHAALQKMKVPSRDARQQQEEDDDEDAASIGSNSNSILSGAIVEHNRLVDEFNSLRHLSRFERGARLMAEQEEQEVDRQLHQHQHRHAKTLHHDDDVVVDRITKQGSKSIANITLTAFDATGEPYRSVPSTCETTASAATHPPSTTETCTLRLPPPKLPEAGTATTSSTAATESNSYCGFGASTATGGTPRTKTYQCSELAGLYARNDPSVYVVCDGGEDWTMTLTATTQEEVVGKGEGEDEGQATMEGGGCSVVRVHRYGSDGSEGEAASAGAAKASAGAAAAAKDLKSGTDGAEEEEDATASSEGGDPGTAEQGAKEAAAVTIPASNAQVKQQAAQPGKSSAGKEAGGGGPATNAATAAEVKQAAAQPGENAGKKAGGGGPEIVPPVPEQAGGQAGLKSPTFPPKEAGDGKANDEAAAEAAAAAASAHHPQDVIVDKEPIEATAAKSTATVPIAPHNPTAPTAPGGGQGGQGKTMTGGLLNSFQSAPLSQGIGTHYATVWVGSPLPQRQSVIVDTGSHHTAFPCKECAKCGEEYHTDKYFDHSKSETFHVLACNECEAGARCGGAKRCQFSQKYAEGSSWRAYQARDRFYCGANGPRAPSNPVDLEYAIDFTFGCQTSETGLFITQLADGIMGMAANDATLTKRMYQAGKLQHLMFSMCFRRELSFSKEGVTAGVLTLGGIDTRLDSTPMVYARNTVKEGWFTVRVRGVYLRSKGGQSAQADDSTIQLVTKVAVDVGKINSGRGVIVDSGTTDTYFHRSLATPFAVAYRKITGRDHNNRPVKLSREELLALPTVLVQLEAYDEEIDPSMGSADAVPGMVGSDIDPTRPTDVLVAIPATHYMEYTPEHGTYTSRLYFTEGQGGVLGANAMMGHDVLFDWENGRVGFAESSCEYGTAGGDAATGEGEGGAAVEDAGTAVDCKVGVPSLDQPCLQTVDLGLCHGKDPAATTLRGVEKWALVVESPGTPKGKSCEEVILTDRPPKDGDKVPKVYCDGNGLCFDERSCEVKCSNAEAMEENTVVPVQDETEGGDEQDADAANDAFQPCGDNLWGACEYTCNQTKITSILMSDGLCHEDEASRATRPCHIDACGISDPCRVPFVVHAVMAFRGAKAPLWSKRSEDLFASAFAGSVNNEKSAGDQFVGPGDVRVLMASEWYDDDDASGSPLGMKVVTEISIYNPKAKLPDGYVYEPITKAKASTLASNSTSSGNANTFITNVKAVWKEWTKPMATCEEADIYALAHNALDVHMELERPTFMAEFIDALHRAEGSKYFWSPFAPLYEGKMFAEESEFLSSWTIKSEIGGGTLHEHTIPTIRGFNKDTIIYYVTNIPFMTVVLTLFFCVCCCGICFGSKCARSRQDRLQMDSLLDVLKERNTDKERGRYEKVGANGDSVAGHHDENDVDDDEHEISFGGNLGYRDRPEDHEPDDAEDLELAEMDAGEYRMSRLKSEL